ncbi:hypothetical protein AQUCO_00100348v1 [Aquilegia coerulea]|uniref:VOC domain-containing protein n=1 Tax=Aquilegia coerulea TaxID=218851 RepID=A0A2G5FA73_AQUCA|nr:hypothetical protein AQUCO_00100348v1 [Aquilegia coerulea]
MVRILPMASSSLHLASLRPCFSSLRFSSSLPSSSFSSRSTLTLSSYNPSRRLTLFHLGTVIPQAHIFGIRASKFVKSEGYSTEAGPAGNVAQASTGVSQENALEWVKKDNRRMLHVVYRVGDLDKTIKFYTECLGMKLLRKRDIPEERYTNAFLGYGPEDSHFVVELTYNYGVDKYDIGAGFGHFGIAVEDYTIAMMGYGPEDKNVVLELTYNYGVTEYDKGNAYAQIAIGTDDVYKTAEAIKLYGGQITREPGPLPGISTKITACLDPDGWKSVFVDNLDFLKELE